MEKVEATAISPRRHACGPFTCPSTLADHIATHPSHPTPPHARFLSKAAAAHDLLIVLHRIPPAGEARWQSTPLLSHVPLRQILHTTAIPPQRHSLQRAPHPPRHWHDVFESTVLPSAYPTQATPSDIFPCVVPSRSRPSASLPLDALSSPRASEPDCICNYPSASSRWLQMRNADPQHRASNKRSTHRSSLGDCVMYNGYPRQHPPVANRALRRQPLSCSHQFQKLQK